MKHRLSSINTCAGIWTLCAGCVCVLTFRDVLPSSSLCSLWWMSLHTVIAGLFKCVFNGYICWHSHNVYSKWSKDFSRLNYSTIQYGWLYPADCTHNVFLTATSAATLWFHLLPNKSLDSAGRNDNDWRTDEDGRRRTDGDWRTDRDRDTQTDVTISVLFFFLFSAVVFVVVVVSALLTVWTITSSQQRVALFFWFNNIPLFKFPTCLYREGNCWNVSSSSYSFFKFKQRNRNNDKNHFTTNLFESIKSRISLLIK